MRVSESAGLSANLNFIRLEVYDSAANMLERQEIGSAIFTGGNRLNANSSRDFNVLMGFNAEPRSGRFVRIAVGTTDRLFF